MIIFSFFPSFYYVNLTFPGQHFDREIHLDKKTAMRILTLSLPALLLASCTTLLVTAQEETQPLDAGYLHLKKDFTQTITIKGSDLERMPFGNLSEALSPWLYGAYTQSGSLQYVVDGVRVTDVNAYSVHDIEEVVLVENAAALGGTAGGQQELVLIRTKRNKEPGGLTATAQSGLVNADGNGTSTRTRFYHDYYVGGWHNDGKFSAGASLNLTRDVFPMANQPNEKEITPFNLERWRFNGYVEYRLNTHNVIGLTLNFTSLQLNYLQDSIGGVVSPTYFFNPPAPVCAGGANHQNLTMPALRWQGNWLPGLRNEFMTTYLTTNSSSAANEFNQFRVDTTLAQSFANQNAVRRSHHLLLRDHLSYTVGDSNWRFEPALDLSYENIEFYASNAQSTSYDAVYPAPAGYIGVGYIYANADYQNTNSNILFATPSVDLSYRKTFDLLGGMQFTPSQWEYSTNHRYLPFASLSLDVLHLADPDAGSSLKLFASYAQRTVQSTYDYRLMDVSSGLNVNPSFPFYYGAVYTGTPVFYAPLMDSTFNYGVAGKYLPAKLYTVPNYWVWSLGASFTAWQDRLQVQYYFERRNFTTAGVLTTSATDSLAVFPEWRSTLHHADLRMKLIDEEDISWTSDLNLTLLRSRTDAVAGLSYNPGKPVVGDVYPNAWSYTGGWVNRLRVNNFTAGLDLLYHFGEYGAAASKPGQSLNSVLLPNIYAGYRWRLKEQETVELFLQSRGLISSSGSDLLDQRRYYTLGGKFSL